MNAESITTIAEARRLGFRLPLADHYGGEQITLKGKTLVRNPYLAQSKTAWEKLGYVVVPNAEPHAAVTHGVRNTTLTYPIYRHDQTEQRVVNTRTGEVVSVTQPAPVIDPRRNGIELRRRTAINELAKASVNWKVEGF